MADHTHIQWTEATWNPLVGCEEVSPGCQNCYAAHLASGRLRNTPTYKGLAVAGKFTGEVRLLPERLTQPLRWKRPRLIFVNSMSDLFHKDVTDEFIAEVFAVMALAPQHTFQVLTKRPARMRVFVRDYEPLVRETAHMMKYGSSVPDPRMDDRNYQTWPLPNVWLGTSLEDQKWAGVRLDNLRATNAAVRFISAEPLLGPLGLDLRDIGWVIVGGESGPGARPMNPDWARSLRDQCQAAGVPFLFKQWGEWVTEDQSPQDIVLPSTSWLHLGDAEPSVYKVGKHKAGRELDGREWSEYPHTLERTHP